MIGVKFKSRTSMLKDQLSTKKAHGKQVNRKLLIEEEMFIKLHSVPVNLV